MAQLSNCQMCSLSKDREHVSFSRGNKPASVMIVFNREPKSDSHKLLLLDFIRQLNYELKHDFYYTFAIKCFQEKQKINVTHIQKCRAWLKSEIVSVEPELVVLMGSLAKIMVLGGKYRDMLQPNIFYTKDSKTGGKKEFFIGENIMGNRAKVETNLSKLLTHIRAMYNG